MQSIESRHISIPSTRMTLIIAVAALTIGILGATGIVYTAGASEQELQLTEHDNQVAPAPKTTRPAARSYEDIQFLEMNIDLPEPVRPIYRSYDEIRLWEMNTLPGDNAPYYPMPSEHQSNNPEINY